MTIGLAIWLIFKTVVLAFIALLMAALAVCFFVGSIAMPERAPKRWLPPALLGTGLGCTIAFVFVASALARIIMA